MRLPPHRADRLAHAAILTLVASHVAAQVVAVRGADQLLDTDGHLVRTVNAWAWLALGDPVFATGVGLPTWGSEVHPGGLSPYPPGYLAAWLPAVALLDGEVVGYRLWSVGVGAAVILGAAALAWRVAGRVAAVVTTALLAGSAVWNGLGAQATLSTLVAAGPVAVGWALAGAEGFRRRGSGVAVGAAVALALQLKWSGVVLLAPMLGLAALGVAAESGRARAGVLALVAVALAEAAVIVAGVRGALPAERLVGTAAVLVAGGAAWGIARWAAGAGVARLPELARAAAVVLGPGLLWYGASTPELRFYGSSGAAGRERGTLLDVADTTLGFLSTQLPLAPVVLGVALVAGLRLRDRAARPVAVGAVVAGVGFAGVVALSGESRLLWSGGIAARLWLESLPLLAVAGGVAVTAAGRRAGWVAAALALALGATTWSFAWGPCAAKPPPGAVFQWCGEGIPRWNPVSAPTAWRLPVDRALPAAATPRVTAVLVPDRKQALADEAPYVRGLRQKGRALPLVGVRPPELTAWASRYGAEVDDLVLVGLPAEAVRRAGFAPARTRAIDAGPGPRAVTLLEDLAPAPGEPAASP